VASNVSVNCAENRNKSTKKTRRGEGDQPSMVAVEWGAILVDLCQKRGVVDPNFTELGERGRSAEERNT